MDKKHIDRVKKKWEPIFQLLEKRYPHSKVNLEEFSLYSEEFSLEEYHTYGGGMGMGPVEVSGTWIRDNFEESLVSRIIIIYFRYNIKNHEFIKKEHSRYVKDFYKIFGKSVSYDYDCGEHFDEHINKSIRKLKLEKLNEL